MAIFSPAPPLPPKTNKAFANPAQLQEYLSTLPTSPATAFDEAEHKYLEHIYQLFGALGISRPAPIVKPEQPQPANPYKSNLKGVRVRKLFSPQICLLPHPVSPAGGAAIFQAPPEPKQASMPLANSKSQILNPKKAPIPKIQIPKKPLAPPTKPITQTVSPTFASGVVMPHSLDKPNLITGIVLDKTGKIIPNVIIEIRDKQDLPIRALKSNKLGQFFTATPLSDGIYQIQAEQAGQKFAIIKLEAKNEIIPPLKIQAL